MKEEWHYETYWLLIMRSAETAVVAAKKAQILEEERIVTYMMKKEVYRMWYRNIIRAEFDIERKEEEGRSMKRTTRK